MNASRTISRLLQAPWEHFPVVSSTNAVIARMNPDEMPNGFTCSADRQEAGKGRKTRTWCSPIGGLYFSVLLKPSRPPADWGLFPLMIANAAANAIEQTCSGAHIGLKWPNDLILNKRKVGGILCESTIGTAPRIIAGIGINVFLNKSALPARLIYPATSLAAESVAPESIQALAETLRRQIFQHFIAWEDEPESVIQQWTQRSVTRNRNIQISNGRDLIRGWDRGIDGNGNLRLESGGIILRFSAGDIVNLKGETDDIRS